MSEGGEECELQQLVPPDDDSRATGKSGEVTPPITPSSKVTLQITPAPNKEKLSTKSTTGGSVAGTGSASQASNADSRSLIRIATAPTIGTSSHATPNTGGSLHGSQPVRLLYVNEKLSRGPSLTFDQNSRPQKEPRHNPPVTRLHNKREPRGGQRSCQHHSFLSDVTDVRRMETALLQLLEDFHSGKLRAFGKDCSMEQMTRIREQQERLARLHFDLGAQQELYAPLSDEGLRADQENKLKLMDRLEELSLAIEQLHSFSSESREGSLQD